jgi:hypothetical protein
VELADVTAPFARSNALDMGVYTKKSRSFISNHIVSTGVSARVSFLGNSGLSHRMGVCDDLVWSGPGPV